MNQALENSQRLCSELRMERDAALTLNELLVSHLHSAIEALMVAPQTAEARLAIIKLRKAIEAARA